MTSKAGIKEFLNQRTLAVVGVSRSNKKFSYRLYKNLQEKGYRIYPVNPNTGEIDGEKCFASILALPQTIDGVVIVVPPNQTEKVVQDAVSAGIKHIWIQQGAESQAAIDICNKNGINVIHKQCILMYAEPTTFPHNLHHQICKVLGKLPN